MTETNRLAVEMLATADALRQVRVQLYRRIAADHANHEEPGGPDVRTVLVLGIEVAGALENIAAKLGAAAGVEEQKENAMLQKIGEVEVYLVIAGQPCAWCAEPLARGFKAYLAPGQASKHCCCKGCARSLALYNHRRRPEEGRNGA